MKRCSQCVLPETFPGVQIGDDGICQYCRRLPSPEKRAEQKARLRARFEDLVDQVRSNDGYHCLVSWSGGKDSTYTLWLLRKKYGLRVLAFTFDNGFVSPGAFENMRVVAEELDVDHVTVKPSFSVLQKVFVSSMQPGLYPPRALERASAICNSCMALAKGIGLRMALEQRIPLLAYGWSPGQIPLASTIYRTNRRMLRTTVQAAMSPLTPVAGAQLAVYFPEERHIKEAQEFPYNVSPLVLVDYSEEIALRCVRTLGWTRPLDTDPNSTNCLLNCFGNRVHLDQMGYHPYVMELAGLVREGYMSREEALAKLETPDATQAIEAVAAKLGVQAFHEG